MKTKQILRLILVVFSTLFVLFFALMFVNGYTFSIDQKFINAAYKLRVDWLTVIVKIYTSFASIYAVGIITLLLVLLNKDWKIKVVSVFNVGVASLLNILVKHIVKRPRPDVVALIVETGYSFPSGHSMLAMAMYGFLAYLAFKYIKNVPIKYFLSIFSCITGILIALSRVYLGVHYFTDIVCGLVLGMAVLVVSIMCHKYMIALEDKIKNKRKE